MQFNSNSSNDLYSNFKRTAAENQSENNIMEEHLQELYKYFAEKNLRMPAQSDFDRTDIDWNELNQLYERIDFYLSSEIRTASQNAPVLYAEKFRHFTHLFFAEEKLDLESKYKDGASVKYVGHRSQKDDGKRKGKRELKYAIYEFVLNQENMGMEELVLYSKVNIAGLSGSITKINRESNSIEVAFQDKNYQTTFNESENYAIELQYNERLYYAHMRSIWLYEKLGRGKFAVFPNGSDLIPYMDFQRMLSKYEIELRKKGGNGFDKQQNCAIFSIVNGLHGSVPFILWGPPGTGKTVTIVECIRQLVAKDPNNRILICTPSNTAADLIARRIYEDGTILDAKQMRRYYSLGKNVNDRDRKLDKIIKIENTALFGLSDGRFAIEDFNEMKKDNIRLIFSTLACSTYLEERIQDEDFITHIFIDEASQSFEPETLIPITRFATEKTRIILSGDYQQLGAVMKAHFLKSYKQCTTSMMERLITMGSSVYNDGRTYCQLTDSYRCHPHIIKFSSDNFYGSKLRAVKGDERTGFCEWSFLPKKNFPIILHIVSTGTETRQGEGRSFYNAGELEVVLDYIRHIRTTMPHIEDKEIGVISPYKFQTQKIRERLIRNPNITVDSVECYQGSERRVIIMSLARSDQPGFLTESKRINTSFTRAKELLIVVLSLSFVRNLHNHRANYWNAFINYCMENEAITIDKFVGENGRELSAQEISTFRHQIRNSLYSTPAKMTPREERKKLPPELAHNKEKEQWRDPNEIKSIPIVPKSSSSHSSSAFVPINSPTNSTSTTSSSSSTSTSLQEFSSTSSSNAQNIQQKEKIVTRQLVSPEKAKEMLREIRRAKGEEEEISSNSEVDGKEFWAHQFANCPTANKMGKRIRNKESALNPYGIVAQMGPSTYEDRSEPIYINALICHENEDEEREDSELSELLGMHSDSPKEESIFAPLPEPLIQPVSDVSNSTPAKNIPEEAIEIASEGAENLTGNADTATSSGGHWKFEKQSSKNCAIM